ncbi:MAG: ATP synthase F1 subunit epsilon [Clostridia bacterium]
MASTFSLEIVTPEKLFFREQVEMLVFKTPEGEIGILKSHAPIVAAVVASSIRIKQNDKWRSASVASGFAQVLGDQVVLLVDSAEWPEEIDFNRALEAKKRAEERLQKSINAQEQAQSQAALSRALARLSVKDL